jgi:hypothetical protein
MDFIAGWILRLCELRDAIVQGQTTGFTLIPNFLTALWTRTHDFDGAPDPGHTLTEYAVAVAALAIAALVAFHTTGSAA